MGIRNGLPRQFANWLAMTEPENFLNAHIGAEELFPRPCYAIYIACVLFAVSEMIDPIMLPK